MKHEKERWPLSATKVGKQRPLVVVQSLSHAIKPQHLYHLDETYWISLSHN